MHIVGEGPEKCQLEKLVEKYDIKKYIIFYGVRTGNDLDKLYQDKDVGVASLGLHRKGIAITSELKIREFFAKGLPFIIGTTDPSIEGEEFQKFYKQFPADESYIDMEEVIKFYENCRCDSLLRKKMRALGEKTFDWSIQMKKIINIIVNSKDN